MQATQKDSLGPPSSLLSLVDWEHSVQRTNFPLLTIHSLTLDDNPKYIYLKQLISQYNDDPEPNRPRYQQTFIQKLFKMMSEVSRMEGIQNQLSTLQKIYAWATKEKPVGPDRDQINGKRPQTASSRTKITRPTTAYSKPPTLLKQAETNNRPGTAVLRNNGFEGGKRPQTGTLRKKMVPTQTISQQEVVLLHQAEGNLKFLEGGAPSNFPMVHPQNLNSIDYSKLGFGECEFYTGGRTLYPEEEHPAKKLKDYERKLFQEDEEVEMIDLSEADQKQEEQAAREKLKQLQLSEQKILREIDEANSPEEPKAEGAEEGDNAGEGDNNQNLEGDINVDDIPLEGEEEQPGLPELEEEPEVVDRLRPRLKAYGELGPKEMKHFEKKHYEGGCLELRMARNQKERKDQEDRVMAKLQAQWAQAKGRARSEMKRRAESARIVKKILPDSTTAIMKEKEIESRQNIINFQNVTPAVISYSYGKETRPATAFLSDRSKEREHVIKNSLLNGQIKAHNAITQQEGVFNEVSLVRRGENPKKKTFEEILKEAEERVVRESEGEIEGVKEAFSKNKISFGVNRIAKSITYEEREISEWEGAVSGMTMLKNPFIKVAKKKKKKKRKN